MTLGLPGYGHICSTSRLTSNGDIKILNFSIYPATLLFQKPPHFSTVYSHEINTCGQC